MDYVLGTETPQGMLSGRDRMFADEYLKTMDQTRAFIAMCKALSVPIPKHPLQAAMRLLQKPEVIAYLREERDKRQVVAGIEKMDVLLELRDQLSVNMGDVADWDQTGLRLKPSNGLNKKQLNAIRKVTCKTTITETCQGADCINRTIETVANIELHDRSKIIEMTGKAVALFEKEAGIVNNNTQVLMVVPAALDQKAWVAQTQAAIAEKIKADAR